MESQRVRLDLGLNNKTIKRSDLNKKGKQQEIFRAYKKMLTETYVKQKPLLNRVGRLKVFPILSRT